MRDVILVVNNIMRGKTNARGEFTLTASTTTTTVTDPNVGEGSVIIFTPVTANAAIEHTLGTMYYTSTKEEFTVTHDNNATTDRTFRYAVIG